MTLRKLKSLIKHTGVNLVRDNKTMVYTVTLPDGDKMSDRNLDDLFKFIKKSNFYWDEEKILEKFIDFDVRKNLSWL